MNMSEIDEVRERYKRRNPVNDAAVYNPLKPDVLQRIHQKQRAILQLFSALGLTDLSHMKLVEIGCGTGENLLEFLRFGFLPENLKGIELLEDRAAEAAGRLPAGIILQGDATDIDLVPESQDIVFQSVVFSSLLDDGYQEKLAGHIWKWIKPGGGVLWYDFVYNNPRNPDVRGVPFKRIHTLFPAKRFIVKRVSLAPPVSRFVSRIHPSLCAWFSLVPFLRSHLLCWVEK
jgi:SAM-dependent methyltransferase